MREEELVSFRGMVPGEISMCHQSCTHPCACMSSANWWERKESKLLESRKKRCRVDVGGARRNKGEYEQNTLYACTRFSKNKNIRKLKNKSIRTYG